MERNLTEGSVIKNIAVFSPPYFLTYFLQALYGLADLYFIGKFDGADVITAVSVGSQIMHMLTVMIVGFAVAATVRIGHAVGSGDNIGKYRTIRSSVIIFAVISVAATVLLLIFAKPIVALLQTPEVSVQETVNYLKICFAGIPAIVAYNLIAAIYRGLGDSRTPLYFVAVAAFVNIVLDYVLIGPMDMSASGAALATVTAQIISVLFSIVFISVKGKDSLKNAFSKKNSSKDEYCQIIRLGTPIALQEGFIQVSFLLITMIANSRGEEIAAAVGIVEKIITFVFLVPSTMMSSTAALCAQNLGAAKPDRAKKTLFCCMGIAAGIGLIFFAISNISPESLVGKFTTDSNVIAYGSQYVRSYSIDAALASIHFCFSGYFNASGHSMISFTHNAIAIVTARVPGTYLASVKFPDTLFPMGMAAPTGSFVSVIICIIFYLYYERKNKKEV